MILSSFLNNNELSDQDYLVKRRFSLTYVFVLSCQVQIFLKRSLSFTVKNHRATPSSSSQMFKARVNKVKAKPKHSRVLPFAQHTNIHKQFSSIISLYNIYRKLYKYRLSYKLLCYQKIKKERKKQNHGQADDHRSETIHLTHLTPWQAEKNIRRISAMMMHKTISLIFIFFIHIFLLNCVPCVLKPCACNITKNDKENWSPVQFEICICIDLLESEGSLFYQPEARSFLHGQEPTKNYLWMCWVDSGYVFIYKGSKRKKLAQKEMGSKSP